MAKPIPSIPNFNFNFRYTLITLIVLITLLIGSIVIRSMVLIPAGYKGIKVNVLGSEKGSVQEIPAGRYFTFLQFNVQYFRFPIFNQNYVWTANIEESSPRDESFTFSINGMPVNIDVGIEYYLEEGKIADLFLKYRKNVEELTDITIRNVVRDNFNRLSLEYDIDTLMSGGMTELLFQVEENSRNYFSEDGIHIKSLSLVNAPRYPLSIVQAIEEKNTATQRAIQRENELREVEAEAQKRIAQAKAEYESAKFQAMANKEISQSISQILINKLWIEKWDGKLPTTMAGESGLLINPGK